MASVNDIGVPGQPMDNPPLTPWQAAVRDVLDGSDVPISQRNPTDSGVITPSTGYVDHGGYGLRVVRTWGICVVNGQFRPTAGWTSNGSSVQIGTVPAGFRPTQPRTAPCVFVVGSPVTSGYACVVVLNPDGQLRVILPSGIAVPVGAGNYFTVNLSYEAS